MVDRAKYPFLEKAAEHVREMQLRIQDLEDPQYKPILDRAESRVKAAVRVDKEDEELTIEERDYSLAIHLEEEIFSFPIAVIMVVASRDPILKGRFADFEAKRVSNYLRGEREEKIIEIARNFGWKIRGLDGGFAIHFLDYLKNAVNFHEAKWKLVNRSLVKGEVLLSRSDAIRLLEEEARRYVEDKLKTRLEVELPENVKERIEGLRMSASREVARFDWRALPKETHREAFPPCINSLYNTMVKGERISHVGRFTLTSFLLNVGFKPEEVVKLFSSISDFKERMTRYQVEHIAGVRGSRTRYLSPKCSTLKTHRLCIKPDDLCGRVRHPLTYYRRKVRMLKVSTKKEVEDKSGVK